MSSHRSSRTAADVQLARRVVRAIHSGTHRRWVLIRSTHALVRRNRQKVRVPLDTLILVADELGLPEFESHFRNLRKTRFKPKR